MHHNGASLYGCDRADLPKPEWGRWTIKAGRLYAHILERGIGPVNLRGLESRLERARLLADDSEIHLTRPWNAAEFPDDAFINFPTAALPDEWDTVVELVLK